MDQLTLGVFSPSALLEVALLSGRLAGRCRRRSPHPAVPQRICGQEPVGQHVVGAGEHGVKLAGPQRREHGCGLLADVTRLGPYLGTVVARLRQAPGAEQVDRLVRVLGDAARAIGAGGFEREASDAAARLLGLPPESAAEHVAVLRDPLRGLIGDGAVDVAALTTLVDLRRRFLPAPELDGLTGRFDELLR